MSAYQDQFLLITHPSSMSLIWNYTKKFSQLFVFGAGDKMEQNCLKSQRKGLLSLQPKKTVTYKDLIFFPHCNAEYYNLRIFYWEVSPNVSKTCINRNGYWPHWEDLNLICVEVLFPINWSLNSSCTAATSRAGQIKHTNSPYWALRHTHTLSLYLSCCFGTVCVAFISPSI